MTNKQLQLLGFFLCFGVFMVLSLILFNPRVPPVLLGEMPKSVEKEALPKPQIELSSVANNEATPTTDNSPPATTEPTAPAVKPEPTAPAVKVNKQTFVQVGSFGALENAQNMQKKLQKKYPVRIEEFESSGKKYHRVLIGPIKENASNRYLEELKALNIEARIIQL